MDKIKLINNATVLFNDDFITDPWIYGNLYNNSWSPYPKLNFKKKNLKNLKFCFISHLHQDHWDLDTIKYFNKNVTFFIPNLPFNRLIKNKLSTLGFKKIIFLDFGKFKKISSEYDIAVVPPLNSDELETDLLKNKKSTNIAIDTGIVIKSKRSKKNFLLLFDNSPYDYSIFKKYFNKLKIDLLFFNYNGFAQDYPIKYDQFKLSEKKKISYELAIKKEQYLKKFIKKIKPTCLIPFSSDFILNQDRELFLNIHNSEFLNKANYSKRISKFTGIKSFGLYSKDNLFVNSKYFIDSKSTDKDRYALPEKIKLSLPRNKNKQNFEKILKTSIKNTVTRLLKYKYQISNDKLGLDLGNEKYLINFKKNTFEKCEFKKQNILILKSKKNIIKSILKREIHFDNATIGCILNWERYPNKPLRFRKLYENLNFFHI